MKRIDIGRRWVCALLVLTAAIGCMGCTGKTPRGEMVETPTVLTHVFDGVSLVPERSDDTIRGYYGIHDGAMQFGITSRESSGTQGEDDYHFYSRWFVRALPIDGGEPVERTISETRIDGTDNSDAIDRDAEYVPFTGEPVVYYFGARTLYLYSFYSYAQGETIYSLILDHGDGTEGRCENLKTTVAQNGVMYLLADLNVDDAGNLYIATGGNELYVLRPDLTLAFRLEVQSNDKFLNAGYDGRMYLWYWDMPAYNHHLAPIDLTGEKLGPAIQLPTANARGAFFGDGYDVYYYTKYGIYGYHFGAENGELVMNFQNSNATAGIDRIYCIERDAFLLEYAAEYRGYVDNFVYYRKGADIDLSQVTVVDIASADYPDEFLTKITRFNRAHKDIRAVMNDYSRYDTAAQYNAGTTRLGYDMVSGLYKPDILVGRFGDTAYKAAFDNGMLADLNPIIDADAAFDRADLFDCVERTYTADGRFFAFPDALHITTLITSRDTIGDKTAWTLEDALDMAENLPQDVSMFDFFAREYTQLYFLNRTYSGFIDRERNECRFDEPLFLRYLTYTKSLLPAQQLASDGIPFGYNQFRSGKTRFERFSYTDFFDWFEEQGYFGKEKLVRIGYPTVNGKCGGTTLAENTYLYSILEKSEKKDAAWLFLREAVDGQSGEDTNMPVYRTDFAALVDSCKDTYVSVLYDGGGGRGLYNERLVRDFDRSKGELILETDVDWDEIQAWIDSIGLPITEYASDARVWDIVYEEMETYLNGSRTAELTGDFIESRVSIYLEETKKGRK